MPYKRLSWFSWTFSIPQILVVLRKMDFFNTHSHSCQRQRVNGMARGVRGRRVQARLASEEALQLQWQSRQQPRCRPHLCPALSLFQPRFEPECESSKMLTWKNPTRNS